MLYLSLLTPLRAEWSPGGDAWAHPHVGGHTAQGRQLGDGQAVRFPTGPDTLDVVVFVVNQCTRRPVLHAYFDLWFVVPSVFVFELNSESLDTDVVGMLHKIILFF